MEGYTTNVRHCSRKLWARFSKEIQDWILKSERNQSENRICVSLLNRSIQDLSDHSASKEPKNPVWKWILQFLWRTMHDPRDPGLICLVKKREIYFRILSDLKIQSWIFLKKRTLSDCFLICPSPNYRCFLFVELFSSLELLFEIPLLSNVISLQTPLKFFPL